MLIPLEPQLLNNLNKQYLNNYMFRIKYLYIKDYKNIHDQKFDFSNNTGYIALIGLNGSGKSNLLEAISLIFDELFGIEHSIQNNVDGYIISYEIDGQPYTCATLDENNNIITLDKKDKFFPSSVIACYSGEDLRLWNMAYMPYYMRFFNEALHGKDYVPQTLYINKYCWKIAIISLLFSLDRDVVDFVKNVLHIDVKNVTVQFAYNEIGNPQPHDAYNWIDRVKGQYGSNDIPLEELRDFGLGNTIHTDLTEDKLIFYYLYFLSMPKKSPRQPVDKIITDITIKLGTFEFDSLSEGEKKMILIACITQILGDDNTLVLLDEPDAHVHIEYKKKILETIEHYNGQTIFTTHSPSICKYISTKDSIKFLNHGVGSSVNNQFNAAKILLPDEQLFYLLFSTKHIVITEGKTDCTYIQKAISLLSPDYPILENNTVFISVGGTDHECVKDLLLHIPDIDGRKIIVLVDRDNSGLTCAKKLIGIDQLKKEDFINERTLASLKLNSYVLMLPNNRGDQSDFIIEDYFDNDMLRNLTINEINTVFVANEVFNHFPPVKNDLKQKLLPDFVKNSATATDVEGFRVLLNKLTDILR